jgi:aryl-alcohol dehydrogenase-like predicted oxidoreductase
MGQVVKELASELDKTPSQVAIAWVLAQRKRANIIPIVGARKLSQIQDNLAALSLTLSEKAVARLEEASKIELGFPHDFLVQGRQFVFGETFPLIDDHRA